MNIDSIVEDPELIKDLNEAERMLSKISAYEQKRKCDAGVILIQRRQFKGLYEIISEEEANQLMSKPVYDNGKGDRTCEWGIEFYPRSFFENLKEKYSKN